MNEILEYILYGTICYFPFMLVAYYPLRYFTRYSIQKTFLIEIALATIEVAFFLLGLRFCSDFLYVPITLIVIFNILAYKLLFTINLGRILFNLMLIVNIANFTVIFSQFLLLKLFPQYANLNFQWRNSVCILITELVFVVPAFLYIKHYSDSMIRNSDYDYVWKIAWLIPLLLSSLGFALIYTPTMYADTKPGLYVKESILCGIILICLLLMYSFIAKLIRTQHSVLKLQNNLYHQSIQKMQLKKIESQIQDTRVLRHDLRHHVQLMCNYVDNKEYERLKQYLHQYSKSLEHISQLHYTNNTLVNTVLVYYADLCKSSHIMFDVQVTLPDTQYLQDIEINIISSNLLENAYQACVEIDESIPRFIRVRVAVKPDRYLMVTVDNSFVNDIMQDNYGNFLTTKPDGNGLGLHSVSEIIEKYNGFMNVEVNDNTFRVSISIPIRNGVSY